MKNKHLYLTAILLTLLQIIGGTAGEIGVLLSSIFVFYHVTFSKKLNLVAIFIFLLPNIVFREGVGFSTDVKNQWGETSYIAFYIPSLVNVLVIGPIAVSTRLFSALAVPVRLFRLQNKLANKKFFYLWLISLTLSLIGLYISYTTGLFSAGGITVGLRIVLAIGAVLIPLSSTKDELIKQLNIVIKISVILFLFGFTNEHWIFITASFPALLIFDKSKFWKLIGFISMFIFLYYGNTFTIKFILISSILLVAFNKIEIVKRISKLQLVRFVYLIFPIGIILVISFNVNYLIDYIDLGNINRNLYIKFFDDRLPIWTQTLDFILKSDFFIVASGRDLPLNLFSKYIFWGAGAHNIYLEIARQLGLFSAILLFIIIFHYLYNTIKIQDNFFNNYIFAMLSVYIIYGLTGNSLVYDGVGFMYWLIIGQIYNYSIKDKKYNENSASFSS